MKKIILLFAICFCAKVNAAQVTTYSVTTNGDTVTLITGSPFVDVPDIVSPVASPITDTIVTQRYTMRSEPIYGAIISTENSGVYAIKITLGLHQTDNIAPDFTKDLIVSFSSDITVQAVLIKCEQFISDYLNLINK